jgi:hypothetical protein
VRKRLCHPEIGRLDLDYVKLAADNDEQQIPRRVPARGLRKCGKT